MPGRGERKPQTKRRVSAGHRRGGGRVPGWLGSAGCGGRWPTVQILRACRVGSTEILKRIPLGITCSKCHLASSREMDHSQRHATGRQ